MGVWIDKNETTNARQLQQMYDIFDKYKADPFLGVIIGNEVLFRKDKTEVEMAKIIRDARANLDKKNIKGLKIASSDLGDNWRVSPEFADEVDIVMANIHPFFAGVTAANATAWTYDFWVTNDRPLKAGLENHVISEVGWPSKGGKSCGEAKTCDVGSVASVSEMNTFMEGWICSSLANNTNYFWFEAFDEPWKWTFNEPGKEWEDQWGIMDVDRNLKPGITIPDCGGKTVPALP
jgi:exo-beta-1,3-glucanase (GH17 family)